MRNINVLEGLGNILLPTHIGDAGYDLIASEHPGIVGVQNSNGTWRSIEYIEYNTSVKIAPEDSQNTFSLVFPRSSLSKYNLVLANSVGVIDGGYRGPIKLRFRYLLQPSNLEIIDGRICIPQVCGIYQKGDKIGQLVFMSHNHVNLTSETNSNDSTSRSDGGFGSTGK